MTDKQTPSDWVLIEAAKRSEWDDQSNIRELRHSYSLNSAYTALCDMIQKYEQPPDVFRRVALEEVLEFLHYHGHFHMEGVIRKHFLGDGDDR